MTNIIAFDGFDLYNGTGANTGLQSGWGARNWFYGPSLVAGRFGGQALQMGNGLCETSLPIPAMSAFAVCHAVRVTNLASINDSGTEPATNLLSGGNHQIGWRPTSTGAISVYRGNTLVGTTIAGVLRSNVWHFVEFFGNISQSGAVNIVVDGASRLALTGQNTNNYITTTTIDTIVLGAAGNAGNATQITLGGNNLTWDDFYVTDGASLGERRIEVLHPTADTVQKDFTPDTGTVNYSRVNETLADSSNYVQASTVGNLDLYTMGDLSSTPTAIDAVQLTVFAQKTDASTRAVALVADVSGTRAQTADFTLAVGVTRRTGIMPTAPAGGAWTASSVNAMTVGPKVTL